MQRMKPSLAIQLIKTLLDSPVPMTVDDLIAATQAARNNVYYNVKMLAAFGLIEADGKGRAEGRRKSMRAWRVKRNVQGEAPSTARTTTGETR